MLGLRLASGLMAAVFLLALVLQYNDPDAIFWMLLYAIPLVFSILGAIGRCYRTSLVIAAVYVGLCFYWFPDWSKVDRTMWQPNMKMMGDDVERAREVIGLFIAAIWMTVLGVVAVFRRRSNTRVPETGAA